MSIQSLRAPIGTFMLWVFQIEEKYWAHRRGSDAKSFPAIGSPGTSPDTHNETISLLGDSLMFSSINEPSHQQAKTPLITPFEIEKEKEKTEGAAVRI